MHLLKWRLTCGGHVQAARRVEIITGLESVPSWENKHAASTVGAENAGPRTVLPKESLVLYEKESENPQTSKPDPSHTNHWVVTYTQMQVQ